MTVDSILYLNYVSYEMIFWDIVLFYFNVLIAFLFCQLDNMPTQLQLFIHPTHCFTLLVPNRFFPKEDLSVHFVMLAC
jgi:hypothetical protein